MLVKDTISIQLGSKFIYRTEKGKIVHEFGETMLKKDKKNTLTEGEAII